MEMYHTILIDDTLDWGKEFRDKYGIVKAETRFVFCKDVKVYCCEMTPSYELLPIRYEFTHRDGVNDDEKEEAEEEGYQNLCLEEVRYIHCHSLNIENAEELGECESDDDAIAAACESY
ncbi:hypothetical protein LCGC14_1224330 [marine sediment metagenome]|uniref:Uncharacterized protein n=1 Tax=marine sediment metagenome TaxID=412755 RepID=A0A0F9PEU6_9ZZZZ